MTIRDAQPAEVTPWNADAQLETQTPASLIWLKATDPRVFTPYTWRHGRMTHILFRDSEGEPVTSVYRTVSHYLDHCVGIQDEIHLRDMNAGTQFNYEVNPEGTLIKYSPRLEMPERLQGVIEILETLVYQPDASIEARNSEVGTESYFVSDGQQWLDKDRQPPSEPAAAAIGGPALLIAVAQLPSPPQDNI